ncbi:oxidoreductase [Kitasatospora camelliae]|uniref:Oxidoreductase n=1 Tax=Kitasatospora camelliae TaxID=3156397 RepID=A0AAU8JS68_9ACTN
MEQAPSDWTPIEQGLWQAFRNGEVYDLRSRPERPENLFHPVEGPAEAGVSHDDVDDPFSGHVWGPERTIRAEVIARLLLSGPEPRPGRVASLKLIGARITHPLTLAGGEITHYVELHRCRFMRKVLISEASAGTIRMVGCRIPRLEASRLSTAGDLHLARCEIRGGVRLTDAKIGTDLLLNQSQIGPDRYGRALSADGVSVNQDVEADRIEVRGELSLRSARIGGRLSLRGAQLHSVPGNPTCLNAVRISVGHTLYLSASDDGGWAGSRTVYGSGYGEWTGAPEGPTTPFRAYGKVRLADGRFENACLISDAEFHLGPGEEISLNRIQTPELRFTCRTPPTGRVTLARARVGNLVDAPTSWPDGGRVGLTGFTYESLRPVAPFPVQDRIEWLDGSADFHPESYEQLAAALRRDGLDEDARHVQYAKQRRRRRTLPLPGRLWGHVQDIAVGYGYRPGRAGLWLLLTWAAGAVYFAENPPPAIKPDEQPTWNPVLYALSKVLPLIDLGQGGWNPDRAGQYVSAGLVLTGWVLATTVLAGATRLLQRG